MNSASWVHPAVVTWASDETSVAALGGESWAGVEARYSVNSSSRDQMHGWIGLESEFDSRESFVETEDGDGVRRHSDSLVPRLATTVLLVAGGEHSRRLPRTCDVLVS